MKARFIEHTLQFQRAAGTSRGVLTSRTVWYLLLKKDGKLGIGECAPLPGLSRETPAQIRELLTLLAADPGALAPDDSRLLFVPSLRFALESARQDLATGGRQLLFPSAFTRGEAGIPINGLIWMGELAFMKEQLRAKLAAGFRCIKLKIGALQFDEELALLQEIRREFSPRELTLRVDANGAFTVAEADEKLKRLAELELHSIEQPLAAGNWQQMGELCRRTPLPVALDEELIGIEGRQEKKRLLETIAPDYLVLKPSLHGGWSGCEEWIALAKARGIGWWITSYLESNIGLNAIAQWAYEQCSGNGQNTALHQGLGTGGLFVNNIASPLEVQGETLVFRPQLRFSFPREFSC